MNEPKDRVGMGWRPELAAGIFAHLDRIDTVEVIADDYFGASRCRLDALCLLAAQVPLTLHGVGMGLASAAPADEKRLAAMARLVERVRPETWSEHLAFVRAGQSEIGHLAAVPRTGVTADAAAENIARAARAVGSEPLVENIATLVEPPASTLSEAAWVARVLEAAGCDLLLDLHNIYANGLNHGYDPRDFLRRIPAGRIAAIHLAGGRWIASPGGAPRLLDDHLHDVPDPVFDLLELTAQLAPRPLTVILERDGNYVPMPVLLAQLDRARAALARGRAAQAASPSACFAEPRRAVAPELASRGGAR
jgi:hypothetical protein